MTTDYRLTATIREQEQPQSGEPYGWRARHEWERAESWFRTSVPEVYWLSNKKIEFTKELQFLSYELFRWGAPSLSEDLAKKRFTSLWDKNKAFANGDLNGFGAGVRNYITGDNPNGPNGYLDKHRFCAGITFRGQVEAGYSYNNYITKRNETGDVLWIQTIDPDNLPSVYELVASPWLYFHATVCYPKRTGMFPNGVQAELDIYEPTLVPLFARLPVFWPIKYLDPVKDVADPYKFYHPAQGVLKSMKHRMLARFKGVNHT